MNVIRSLFAFFLCLCALQLLAGNAPKKYVAGQASTKKLKTAIDTSAFNMQIPDGNMNVFYPYLQAALPQKGDTVSARLYNVRSKKIEQLFESDTNVVVMTAGGISCDRAALMADSLIHLLYTFPYLHFAIVVSAETHPSGYSCPYSYSFGHRSVYHPPNEMAFTLKHRCENAQAFADTLQVDSRVKIFIDDAQNTFVNTMNTSPCALLVTDKKGIVSFSHALFNMGGSPQKIPGYGRPIAEYQLKELLKIK